MKWKGEKEIRRIMREQENAVIDLIGHGIGEELVYIIFRTIWLYWKEPGSILWSEEVSKGDLRIYYDWLPDENIFFVTSMLTGDIITNIKLPKPIIDK